MVHFAVFSRSVLRAGPGGHRRRGLVGPRGRLSGRGGPDSSPGSGTDDKVKRLKRKKRGTGKKLQNAIVSSLFTPQNYTSIKDER
jgi:hypothetical protein